MSTADITAASKNEVFRHHLKKFADFHPIEKTILATIELCNDTSSETLLVTIIIIIINLVTIQEILRY